MSGGGEDDDVHIRPHAVQQRGHNLGCSPSQRQWPIRSHSIVISVISIRGLARHTEIRYLHSKHFIYDACREREAATKARRASASSHGKYPKVRDRVRVERIKRSRTHNAQEIKSNDDVIKAVQHRHDNIDALKKPDLYPPYRARRKESGQRNAPMSTFLAARSRWIISAAPSAAIPRAV